MPEPMSVPDQQTSKFPLVVTLGRLMTELLGAELSMVFVQVPVVRGEFASKTIVALLVRDTPVANPCFGVTVNKTLPSPCGGVTSGGRNPTRGSVGRFPVAGSIDV